MLPKNVLLYGILCRLNDLDTFAAIHAMNIEPPEAFWRHRIKSRWTINLPADLYIMPSRQRYLEIAGKWATFVAPLIGCNIEVVEITGNKPCDCPYHMFVQKHMEVKSPRHRDARSNNLERFMQHQTLCMPNYINSEWLKDREVYQFRNMSDLLHWRDVKMAYYRRY